MKQEMRMYKMPSISRKGACRNGDIKWHVPHTTVVQIHHEFYIALKVRSRSEHSKMKHLRGLIYQPTDSGVVLTWVVVLVMWSDPAQRQCKTYGGARLQYEERCAGWLIRRKTNLDTVAEVEVILNEQTFRCAAWPPVGIIQCFRQLHQSHVTWDSNILIMKMWMMWAGYTWVPIGIGHTPAVSNICHTYVICHVNIFLHDILHKFNICSTYMYVEIYPIPVGTQIYPAILTAFPELQYMWLRK